MSVPAAPRVHGLSRIVVVGSVAIVVVDLVIALGVRGLGMDLRFADLSYCSWFVYAQLGYVAVRSTSRFSHAFLAPAICGVVEGTLGWWLASLIVPLHIPINGITPVAVVTAVLVVALTAGVMGSIGGLVRKVVARQSATPG